MDLISLFGGGEGLTALFSQFRSEFAAPGFWLALGEIIWINILLSGDNALVIAMACRGLSPRQRVWGMVLGALSAVLLRIIFTGIVVELMTLPYLKLAGGIALIVIAVKLVASAQEDETVRSGTTIWSAVQIVVVADIVMSLDNVIAVAAAAKGSLLLLILGLALSVPLIIGGAALIMAVLTRMPFLVWIGALLLGWVAGEVIASDIAVQPFLATVFAGGTGQYLDSVLTSLGLGARFAGETPEGIGLLCGALGAILVLVIALVLRGRTVGVQATEA